VTAPGLEIDLRGERVVLLPQGALFRPHAPEGPTLLVADTHFGKDATFRALGIPVPAGADDDTLARLSAALDATRAARLVILGDFFHARAGVTPSTLARLAAWRAARRALAVTLVLGNHDLHAGRPPEALGIEVHDDDLPSPPFLYTHHPEDAPAGVHAYVLGGHVHPAVALPGPPGARTKVPCFFFRPGHGILPSLGAFTGTHPLVPARGDRVFALAGASVLDVTALVGVPSGRRRR
jgi:DNA ligase-associated metallophosphoesterase